MFAFFVLGFEKERKKKKKKKEKHFIKQGSEKSFYLDFWFNTIVIKLFMLCVHVLLKKKTNKTKTKTKTNKQTNKQTIFILSNSDPGVCSVSRHQPLLSFQTT